MLGQIGDFHLLREVGRGGMGIVYEAEQLSLNRRVALKVLPFAAAFDPRQLQRFKNEAQAAGQLHHTNIVPVFAVGTERGVHYYAMQFIDGQSLAAIIADLHQARGNLSDSSARPDGTGDEPGVTALRIAVSGKRTDVVPTPSTRGGLGNRTVLPTSLLGIVAAGAHPRNGFCTRVAELGIKAAEALEHAHQVGVVHRDIKPANLLIDSQGNLWITDFGLAQFHSDLGLTLTGEVLGTLRYMSPEQALAKRGLVDHRTDLYSLGVTLYELLTLEPVFDGRDRHELLRQVAFEEPRPPRRIDPSIPVELETILLKAIAKAPTERYANAQELADDLRRFLDDKPVLARRPSAWVKGLKWCRRHRTVVGSAVVLLVMGILGLMVSMVVIAQEHAKTKEAYRRERQKADEAQEQRALAHQSLLQARRAVDFFTLLSEDDLAHKPQLQRMRKKLLKTALIYHQDFIRQRRGRGDGDPALQAELASSHYRAGRILNELGSKLDALAEFEQAREGMERLKMGHPEVREYRYGLNIINNGLYWLQGCGRIVLLAHPPVQEDLQLSAVQRQAVTELFNRLAEQRRQALRDFQTLKPEAQGRKFRELAVKNERAVAELLTPPQAKRIQQIVLQQQGTMALANSRMVEALRLSDEQRDRLGGIHEALFDSIQTILQQHEPGSEGRESQMLALRANTQAKVLEVLTEAQKERWQELTGPPVQEVKRLGIPAGIADPYLLMLLR